MKNSLAAFVTMLGLCLTAQVNQNTPGWAVFDVPGLEATAGTAVDISYLNTEPAGSHGFIRVKNGKFVDDRNLPLRFYGTNVTGDSCFPDIENAPKLAKLLRRYGFNCLRLHFMDTNWHQGAIWKDSVNSEFNEENLKKLDHFIAACNLEGIYVNINLHVARVYPHQPVSNGTAFNMGKILDRWYPPYIDFQEEYARKLLGRVSTVTGKRYADNPGVMCIEINNENTMIRDFRYDFVKLPKDFQDELARQWTTWLKNKYKTDANLRTVWEARVTPLGVEAVSDKNGWYAENAGGAQSTLSHGEDGGWRWLTTKTGTESWNLQLQIRNLKLEPGMYTARFQARSKTSSSVIHRVLLNADPWQELGLRVQCNLTPEWQDFEVFGQIATPVNDRSHRVNFDIMNKLGEVEIRNYSIHRGGGRRLPDTQGVDSRIDIPGSSALAEQMTDFFAFLIDTEMVTTTRLKNLIKNTIGCKMPVTDTQVNYGNLGGLLREATISDYIDIHSYWEHPIYTRNEKGQTVAFRINNTAAVASPSGGSIPPLALWRVEGKPFSVSEFNTPAPNDHSADMFPLFSVVSSIQDWDAFFSYTYRDFGRDYDNTFIRGYFQFIGRANLLVHIPFASLLYRRHLMPVAQKRTVIGVPTKLIPQQTVHNTNMNTLWKQCDVTPAHAFTQRLMTRLDKTLEAPALLEGDGKMSPQDGIIVSEDGSFKINPSDKDGAWAMLNLPSARFVSGHIGGRAFDIGDIKISVAPRDWPRPLPAFSCISMIALDEQPLATSGKILVAASGRTENTDQKWNESRTTLIGKWREGWGKPPVLSELVPATISLPRNGNVKLSVLDAQGRPVSSRQVDARNIQLTAQDKTLWYLIE